MTAPAAGGKPPAGVAGQTPPYAQADLEARLGYRFRDPALLRQALTHKSAGADNFERLEFLGDSVLGFIIGEALFAALPAASEQRLTLLRASLVNEATLADVARQLGLGTFLHLGVGARKTGGAERPSILANALEALLGAVARDSGFDAAATTVRGLFRERLATIRQSAEDPALDAGLKDPKTRLQEWLQGRGHPLPAYVVVERSGPEHAQVFCVECRAGELAPTRGRGSSRREAEKAAAARALRRLDTASASPRP